jgi:lysine 6-dehydrogenase
VPYAYCVIGAGRQGAASAYDLARFGEARRITLADLDEHAARRAASRVNTLAGSEVAEAAGLDASDPAAVKRLVRGHDVVLSAVPYFLNYALTEAAIECGASFCDLGGNTEIVRRQHGLDQQARRAGVCVVPDCGMGPGLGNNLAEYGMSLLEEPESVYLFDGGLPQHPRPPWNYVLSFSAEGLANEYYGSMTILRDGALIDVPVFTEMEIVDFEATGPLEAFLLAGGCSTAPWTFRDRLRNYQIKTLRYPGTFAQLKAFSDLGLFDPARRRIAGVEIAPREVFKALFEPQVYAATVEDVCLVRAIVTGRRDGLPATATVDYIDYADPSTGFSAMERSTGWHLSIVAALIAGGAAAPGALPLETAFPGALIVAEARRRGLRITESVAEA